MSIFGASELLGRFTLDGSTSGMTITGLPQNFTDLVIVSVGGTTDQSSIQIKDVNGLGASGGYYSYMGWYSYGGGAGQQNPSSGWGNGVNPFLVVNQWGPTDDCFMMGTIFSYSSSTKKKSAIVISGAGSYASGKLGGIHQGGGTINILDPITSITIGPVSYYWTAGSELAIYGVK